MARSKKRDSIAGVLVVDKPEGITSFGVVKAVRQRLSVRKAGHTGTLDPLATGVLPICLGEATKIAGLLTADDKTYRGRARLGLATDTLDITGEVTERRDPGGVGREQVERALARLRGVQLQVPPAFSAVRHGGKRAYELARKGEQVDLAPREVEVKSLELTGWDPPDFEIHLECSKGTYVRTIIADAGEDLGCGAVMTGLRRLRCGAFDLDRSVPLDQVEIGAGGVPGLIDMDRALSHLPCVDVDAAAADRLRHGQPVQPESIPAAELIRIRCDGRLIALGAPRGGALWPRRVFQLPEPEPEPEP